MAKLGAHLLATAALWVRIQTSLKNTKWASQAKEWPKKKKVLLPKDVSARKIVSFVFTP